MKLLVAILILLFSQPAFGENSSIPTEVSVDDRTSLKGGAAYSIDDAGRVLNFWYPLPNGFAGHWISQEMTTGLLGQIGKTELIENKLDVGNAIDSRGVRWNLSLVGYDMWDSQQKVCSRASSIKLLDSGPNIWHVLGKSTLWHLENGIVKSKAHVIQEQISELMSPDKISYEVRKDVQVEYPKERQFKGFQRIIYQYAGPTEITYQSSLNDYLRQIHREDLIPNHLNP